MWWRGRSASVALACAVWVIAGCKTHDVPKQAEPTEAPSSSAVASPSGAPATAAPDARAPLPWTLAIRRGERLYLCTRFDTLAHVLPVLAFVGQSCVAVILTLTTNHAGED